jgi:hypothetical protein
MPIRIPTAREFSRQPFKERARLVIEMRRLLADWAETERP